jgi:pimeloyl-ACP methyl ester carboxylesterase
MFSDRHVDVGGVGIRYREAGQGPPLVHLVDGHGAPPTAAHDLLARQFRVIVLEASATRGPDALARTLETLGLDAVDLVASGDAAAPALGLALTGPARLRALVLESPTALPADLGRRLADVAIPTLVVFGTSDRADAQEAGRVYAGSMPNAHLVFVYDAGSAIGHDRPEAFAEVVADFLERHEAFIINRTATVIHP